MESASSVAQATYGTTASKKKIPPHTPLKEKNNPSASVSANPSGSRKSRSSRVKATANRLIEAFGEPEHKLFYLKVAWKLPESIIWDILERSKAKRNPAKYFAAAIAGEFPE